MEEQADRWLFDVDPCKGTSVSEKVPFMALIVFIFLFSEIDGLRLLNGSWMMVSVRMKLNWTLFDLTIFRISWNIRAELLRDSEVYWQWNKSPRMPHDNGEFACRHSIISRIVSIPGAAVGSRSQGRKRTSLVEWNARFLEEAGRRAHSKQGIL